MSGTSGGGRRSRFRRWVWVTGCGGMVPRHDRTGPMMGHVPRLPGPDPLPLAPPLPPSPCRSEQRARRLASRLRQAPGRTVPRAGRAMSAPDLGRSRLSAASLRTDCAPGREHGQSGRGRRARWLPGARDRARDAVPAAAPPAPPAVPRCSGARKRGRRPAWARIGGRGPLPLRRRVAAGIGNAHRVSWSAALTRSRRGL